jgi:hypothetical protein
MHNFVRCNFNASTRKKRSARGSRAAKGKREKREAPMGSGQRPAQKK